MLDTVFRNVSKGKFVPGPRKTFFCTSDTMANKKIAPGPAYYSSSYWNNSLANFIVRFKSVVPNISHTNKIKIKMYVDPILFNLIVYALVTLGYLIRLVPKAFPATHFQIYFWLSLLVLQISWTTQLNNIFKYSFNIPDILNTNCEHVISTIPFFILEVDLITVYLWS